MCALRTFRGGARAAAGMLLSAAILLLLPLLLTAQPGPTQSVSWKAEKQEGTLEADGSERLTLTGNVSGRQGDISIQADRAVWNGATGRAELRGNVKISQPGTTLTAPAVDYTSGSGVAITPKGAVILDGGARIEAGYGEYYTTRRSALFRNGIVLRDDGITLRASSGTYSSVEQKGVFQGDVQAESDSGTLNADNLTYWRGTDESYATGNVRLTSMADSTLLESDLLRHRPGVETRAIGNVRLTSMVDSTILESDTLINTPDVETLAIGNVRLRSMNEGAELTGGRLRHNNANAHTTVTENPVLLQIDSTIRTIKPSGTVGQDSVEAPDTTLSPQLDTIQRGDSLFTVQRDTTCITATTLERFAADETDKLFRASGSAQISRGEMLATAEVAQFFEDRELITLGTGGPADTSATDTTAVDSTAIEPPLSDEEFPSESLEPDGVPGAPPPLPKTPVVWYEESQMTGDSIAIELREKKVQTIDVVTSAMTISGTDAEGRYDQLAADRIIFNVHRDTIRSIHAQQAAASMYFIFERGRPDGVNRSSGDTIIILFDKGKASRIGIYGPDSRAEGEILPERSVAGNERNYRLDGFVLWERPPIISDLLLVENPMLGVPDEDGEENVEELE